MAAIGKIEKLKRLGLEEEDISWKGVVREVIGF
jgi:hypothetical protein